mmetsp:Transcript_85496/g.169666  ORF Transcript_85496/g.169666 Transcript_85496/m.169666 type:complete len:646 (+) Transcript_85496:34-1971(+)
MERQETPSRRLEEPWRKSGGAVALLQDLRAELLSMHDDRPSTLPEILGPVLQPNLGMAIGSLRELVDKNRAGLVRIEGDVEQLRAELHVVKRSLPVSSTKTERAEPWLDVETPAPTFGEFNADHEEYVADMERVESSLGAAVTAMRTRVAAVEERCKEQVLKTEVTQEMERIQRTIEAQLIQFRDPLDDQKVEEFSSTDEDTSHDQIVSSCKAVACSSEQKRPSLSSLMARVESLEADHKDLRGTPDNLTELHRRMQLLEHNLTDDICSTLATMSTEISNLVQCLASSTYTENGMIPQETMSQAAARRFAQKERASAEVLSRKGTKRREAASLEEPRTALRPEAPRALSRRAGVSASPSAHTGSVHLISRSPKVDDAPQGTTPRGLLPDAGAEEDAEQASERSSKIAEEIRVAAKAMAAESRTGLDQALALLSTSLRQIWHARNQSLGPQSVASNSASTVGFRQELGDSTTTLAPPPALPGETRRWPQPGTAGVAPAVLHNNGSNTRLQLHLPLSDVSQQGAPMSPAVSPRLVPSFVGPGCRATAVQGPEAHRRLATHPRPGSAVLLLGGGGAPGDKMLSQRSQDMTRFVAAPSAAPGGCDVRWMAPPPAGCGVPGRSISTTEAGDSAMLTAKKILMQRQEMQSA